jgi:F-type H+-transporting ATPase subunit epsilon
MARTLLVEIVTPEHIVYTNEVEMVVVPTLDGEIGILPLHAPLVGAIRPGEVRVKFADTTEWFAVSGGYIQVHEDKVIILADDAVIASQIDVERAKQAKALAEARIAELPHGTRDEGFDDLDRELKWAEVQIAVATAH